LNEFVELRGIVFVVLGRVVVTGFVAIPRREINSELQPILSCRRGYFSNDIALARFPRATLHAVVGLVGWPQAEAVMMFCDHDDIAGARGFDRAHPLLGIKL